MSRSTATSWPPIAIGLVVALVLGACSMREPRSAEPGDPARPDEPLVATDPPTGWRAISFRDLQVFVPRSWPDASGATTAWCLGRDKPGHQPYAETNVNYAVPSIGCLWRGRRAPAEFGPAPLPYWAPHVSLVHADGVPGTGREHRTSGSLGEEMRDGRLTFRDWQLDAVTVGDVQVQVLTDPATRELAEPILESAQRFEIDSLGCDARSPLQDLDQPRPPTTFDPKAWTAVDSISVCQYERLGEAEPGLIGSRRLTGPSADDWLAAYADAPAGTEPAEQCDPEGPRVEPAVVVRLHQGNRSQDIYLRLEWCSGNGFDDGAGFRRLTTDTCTPLFTGRLDLTEGTARTFNRCLDDG